MPCSSDSLGAKFELKLGGSLPKVEAAEGHGLEFHGDVLLHLVVARLELLHLFSETGDLQGGLSFSFRLCKSSRQSR